MQGLPAQIDSSWNTGRASRLVAGVLPVARAHPAIGSDEQTRRESPARPPIEQALREELMARHRGAFVADSANEDGRVRRALARYDAVAGIDQRQQLEEMLRFSTWA
ncbi:MAG: hypothetical protein D6720_09605 [Gammaproteobacteria bacterium]|nr:MAG: hypothetical protein D6720_09605 [Gammaproteobacteria bacterium]